MFSYFNCLRKYMDFSGRSSRREYWSYLIVNTLILTALLMFWIRSKNETLHIIAAILVLGYSIVMIIPSAAVTVRRWHDLGRSGAWVFLTLIPALAIGITVGAVVAARMANAALALPQRWYYVFIPFIGAFLSSVGFMLSGGDEGNNKYGRDPYDKRRRKRRNG